MIVLVVVVVVVTLILKLVRNERVCRCVCVCICLLMYPWTDHHHHPLPIVGFLQALLMMPTSDGDVVVGSCIVFIETVCLWIVLNSPTTLIIIMVQGYKELNYKPYVWRSILVVSFFFYVFPVWWLMGTQFDTLLDLCLWPYLWQAVINSLSTSSSSSFNYYLKKGKEKNLYL